MQQVAGGDELDTSDEEGEEDSHSSDESSDRRFRVQRSGFRVSGSSFIEFLIGNSRGRNR